MSQLSPREGHGARATRAGARFPCSAAAAPPGKGAAGREGLRDTSTLFPIQVCSCAGQVSLAGSRCAPAGTRVVGQGLFFGKSREACGQKNRLRERAPEQSLGHNFAVVQGKERGQIPKTAGHRHTCWHLCWSSSIPGSSGARLARTMPELLFLCCGRRREVNQAT